MDTFIEVEHGFGKRLTVLLNCSSVKSRGFSEVLKSEIPLHFLQLNQLVNH